ncbi:unnamed protein product [Phyllotreta striolata]|uniref:Uncharacterized protein n=1 Tax=Phyllotreta striolata TaxID=444603 RepID=A0A9N9XQ99_PHYSR|nr:unnamed protein product [Phyllotreta striolata]
MQVAKILIFTLFLISSLVNIAVGGNDADDSGSIEIPVRKQNTNTKNNGFSVFRPADDALFNFINKLVNTSYLSSKMLLNRARTQSEIRRQIEDQVEEFLENLPTIPIPILDPQTEPKSNHNRKDDN